MRLVILESPYAGNIPENTEYARRALRDCLKRGEAPLASHLLYTQVLDEHFPDDRLLGIQAGLAWVQEADAMVVYADLGLSQGMRAAIEHGGKFGIPVEYRYINKKES